MVSEDSVEGFIGVTEPWAILSESMVVSQHCWNDTARQLGVGGVDVGGAVATEDDRSNAQGRCAEPVIALAINLADRRISTLVELTQ